jgi:hypothetical protein
MWTVDLWEVFWGFRLVGDDVKWADKSKKGKLGLGNSSALFPEEKGLFRGLNWGDGNSGREQDEERPLVAGNSIADWQRNETPLGDRRLPSFTAGYSIEYSDFRGGLSSYSLDLWGMMLGQKGARNTGIFQNTKVKIDQISYSSFTVHRVPRRHPPRGHSSSTL